jgi:ATP-dependent DNA helicase Rep
MLAVLFETGFEGRLAPRQLAPLREFGEFIHRIAYRAAREPALQVLQDLLAAIDYRAYLYDTLDDKTAASRWQNVSDFVDWLKKRLETDNTPVGALDADSAAGSGITLLKLAQTVSLLSQLDRKDSELDAVRLTTIHASKGLEFPHVFVVGCEEGLLPHRGDEPEPEPDEAPQQGAAARKVGSGKAATAGHSDAPVRSGGDARIEEERRLMYVAVTRAQRSRFVSWCKQRKRARDMVSREPSRFIGEMQLQARPVSKVMISDDAAKAKLANLRQLLGARKTGTP